jgi:hypothetical protein
MLAILVPLLGGTFAFPPCPAAPGEAPVLHFFFTPEARGGAAAARQALDFVKTSKNRIRLRPVVLIDRFGGLGKLDASSPFYRTLRELQSEGPLDLPLYDPEGLRLAEAWGIRSVPAFVLVFRGRAHATLGSGASLPRMLECAE